MSSHPSPRTSSCQAVMMTTAAATMMSMMTMGAAASLRRLTTLRLMMTMTLPVGKVQTSPSLLDMIKPEQQVVDLRTKASWAKQ